MNDTTSTLIITDQEKLFEKKYITTLEQVIELKAALAEQRVERKAAAAEHEAKIDEMREEHERALIAKDKSYNEHIQKIQDAHNEEVKSLIKNHTENIDKLVEDKTYATLTTYYEWYTRELAAFKKEAETYEAEFKKLNETYEAELKNLKFNKAATIGATMGIIIAAIAFCSESLVDYLPLMTVMAVPTLIFSYFCNKPQGKKNKSSRG